MKTGYGWLVSFGEGNNIESIAFKALLQSRYCEATNPRDKIYALLPLLHTFDKPLSLTPRYQDSTTKVLTDCAAALIPNVGFKILYVVQGRSRVENLPSWVPDWSVKPVRSVLGKSNDNLIDHDCTSGKLTDDASRIPEVIHTESGGSPMLRVAGYPRGRIKAIGPTYLAGQGLLPFSQWEALLKDEAVAAIDRSEDMPLNYDAKTPLDYNFHLVLGAAGFAYSGALRGFLRKEQRKLDKVESIDDKEEDEKREKPKAGWETIVRELALSRSDDEQSGDTTLPFSDIPFHLAGNDLPPSWQHYVERVLKNCHSRRFFITDTGYMGLAPEEAEVGDHIWMCVGAAIPFALRESQVGQTGHGLTQYRLVGESYLETKAVRDLKRGSDQLEVIGII